MTALQIARFELRYQLRSPQALGSALIFFALGSLALVYINAEGASDIFRLGRNISVNSPFYVAVCTMALSMLSFFIAPAFVGDAILRDRDTDFAGIAYATPVSRNAYVFGRFVGSFGALSLVFLAVPLGMITSLIWAPLPAIGPLHPEAFLAAWLLALPTLFVLSAIGFAIALLTGQLVYTYLANLAVVVLMFGTLVTGAMNGLANGIVLAWLDPSLLLVLVSGAAARWSPDQLNNAIITMDGIGVLMIANRILFVVAGLLVLASARTLFSFRVSARGRVKGRARSSRDRAAHADSVATTGFRTQVQQVAPERNPATAWRQMRRRASFEIRTLLFSAPFLLMTLLSVVFLVDQLRFSASVSIPVTTIMLRTLTSGIVMIYGLIVILIFSPEIIWREQKHNMHEIIDVLPAPNWVFAISKLAALIVLIVAVLLVGTITAMVIQLLAGETPHIGLYAERMAFSLFVPLLFIAVLSLFLQVITPNRYLGGVILLVYLGLTWLLSVFGFSHPLYQSPIGGDIAAPLSAMNADDRFMTGGLWLRAFWLAQAGLLVIASYLLWNRGTRQPLRFRLGQLRRITSRPWLVPASCCALLTIGTGSFIFYNTNILNDYSTNRGTLAFLAEHERRFGAYRDLPMPRITAATMQVDIFPHERRIENRSQLTLTNRSGVPVESIHLEFPSDVEVIDLSIGNATPVLQDSEFGYYIFDLGSPLLPEQSLNVDVHTQVQLRGFRARNEDITLVSNGTYFENTRILPHIGYSGTRIFADAATRQKYGLPPLQLLGRLEDPPDSFYRRNHIARSDSDLVEFEATVSTTSTQTAVTSGVLQEQWSEGDRNYFVYRTSAPVPFLIPFFSAEYAVARDELGGVALEIYYHPEHDYTVGTILQTLRDGLSYFGEAYGPYRYEVLRVVEYPGYRTNSRSLPTTIAHSEFNGMLERDPAATVRTIGHEMSHHWWGHLVTSARVEGALMMGEALASYSSRMLSETKYGREYSLNSRFISPALRYLRQRNRDRSGEVPLDRVGQQNYIGYIKGEVVLYALQDYLGEATLNRALRRLVIEKGDETGNYAISSDLIDILEQEAGPDNTTLIEDMLDRITLYDVRVRSASVAPTEEGQFRVTLSLSTSKLYGDSSGLETPAPFDIPVDIGLFRRTPRSYAFDTSSDVIRLEKQRVQDGNSTIELIVDEEPAFAGIDPYNVLIDRNPDDNVVRIAQR